MKPEEKARNNIDKLLTAARWSIQDYRDLNLGASQGVAVREFPLISRFADYLLFADRKAVGVIEAKPEGTTLTSTEYQSDKYLFSLPKDLPCSQKPLPFAYESTGSETFFRNLQDPDTRSRRVFSFHKPDGDSIGILKRSIGLFGTKMLRNKGAQLDLQIREIFEEVRRIVQEY